MTERADPAPTSDDTPPGMGHVTARQVVLSAAALWLCYFVLVSIRWALVGPPDTDLSIWIELLWRRALVTMAGIAVTVLAWPLLRRWDHRRLGWRVALALVIMLPAALLLALINQQAFAPVEARWDQEAQKQDAGQDAATRKEASQRNTGGNMLIDIAPPAPSAPAIPPEPPEPPAPPAAGDVPPEPPAPRAPKAAPKRDNVSVRHHADGTTEITAPGVHIITREPATPATTAQEINQDINKDEGWQELTDIALGRYFLLIAWAALYLALGNAEQRRAAEWREGEYRRAAKAAELRSLRYQVNPHFLFNTLNSLSALVMVGRTEEAERMIQTISSFYRHSLAGDPTADVTLADEIALQRHYLAIEGVRFPDRLRVEFDVPEDVSEACVPGMILQPLVENSIKYAVSATTRPVTISIRARLSAGLLVLTVADDGPGADHASLPTGGTGIGLANVRSRLAARFGAQARVESAPLPAGGYATVLTLPIVSNLA
ncbi:sensor histidine kinase [Novosphingobium capsulatum]|uniref:sensor histidine kinase n=1 Tax=Novosphingobium capsulatum TaxID=13688 RepID=UPI002E13AD82|nr:histidine kinase [Novosphingobium capsulatum]WQD93385.1 histidine kinase [Novosphingobium capsulatum]